MRTIVYTFNKVHIKGEIGKTPYELWFGNTPRVKYFRIFGSKCYVGRDDFIRKFDPRCDKEYLLVILMKEKHIDVITRDCKELWRVLMSRSMRKI